MQSVLSLLLRGRFCERIESGNIITNESLLDKNIIETKFNFWNIKGVQVTLDGTKAVYETIILN